MSNAFDVIIIGSGPGGYVTAIRLGFFYWEVGDFGRTAVPLP
jgi:pyruvate/2-oxoglutarate dehydrogenase complex dihydrolipoamide dehydrogenase (E3) component